MKDNSVWIKAQSVRLCVSDTVEPGFNIGFDDQIPEDMKQELESFVNWIESRCRIPITLWVDFEYKHYLITRAGKRVGYIFYWADFTTYPVFENPEDIPEIRLPVRTEHSTAEEILTSFIEAITDYFAWICNEMTEGFAADEEDVEEILADYLLFRQSQNGAAKQ